MGGFEEGKTGLMILHTVTSLFKARWCTGNLVICVGKVLTPPHVILDVYIHLRNVKNELWKKKVNFICVSWTCDSLTSYTIYIFLLYGAVSVGFFFFKTSGNIFPTTHTLLCRSVKNERFFIFNKRISLNPPSAVTAQLGCRTTLAI